MSNVDILGNSKADSLAEQAAKAAALPLNIAAPIIYHHRLVSRIQLRLATILVNLPNRPAPIREKPHPKPSLDRLIDASSHIIFLDDDRYKCARCSDSFHKSDPVVKHWLGIACQEIGSSLDRPTPLCFSQRHVGNLVTHASHKLNMF